MTRQSLNVQVVLNGIRKLMQQFKNIIEEFILHLCFKVINIKKKTIEDFLGSFKGSVHLFGYFEGRINSLLAIHCQ